MKHVWISTSEGDLLRADRIRQINAAGGLRVVTTSGSQFLLADVDDPATAMAVARRIAAAIAEADTGLQAAEIGVVREGTGWDVRTTAMTTGEERPQKEATT